MRLALLRLPKFFVLPIRQLPPLWHPPLAYRLLSARLPNLSPIRRGAPHCVDVFAGCEICKARRAFSRSALSILPFASSNSPPRAACLIAKIRQARLECIAGRERALKFCRQLCHVISKIFPALRSRAGKSANSSTCRFSVPVLIAPVIASFAENCATAKIIKRKINTINNVARASTKPARYRTHWSKCRGRPSYQPASADLPLRRGRRWFARGGFRF